MASVPVPHIHDFGYMLNGKNVFSKVDLVKAYHQIPVEKDDIEKTAIITPYGYTINAAKSVFGVSKLNIFWRDVNLQYILIISH